MKECYIPDFQGGENGTPVSAAFRWEIGKFCNIPGKRFNWRMTQFSNRNKAVKEFGEVSIGILNERGFQGSMHMTPEEEDAVKRNREAREKRERIRPKNVSRTKPAPKPATPTPVSLPKPRRNPTAKYSKQEYDVVSVRSAASPSPKIIMLGPDGGELPLDAKVITTSSSGFLGLGNKYGKNQTGKIKDYDPDADKSNWTITWDEEFGGHEGTISRKNFDLVETRRRLFSRLCPATTTEPDRLAEDSRI